MNKLLVSKVMEIVVVIVCSELQIVLSGKKIITNPSKECQQNVINVQFCGMLLMKKVLYVKHVKFKDYLFRIKSTAIL